MNKEFLDFLYEQRATIQGRIDKLVEQDKQPRNGDCQGCPDAIKTTTEAHRMDLLCINKIIEKYISIKQ